MMGPGRGDAAETLLAAMPMPLIVLDQADTLVAANPAAEQFFGMSEGAMLGLALNALVPFGSPVVELADAARAREGTVSERGVDLSTPRAGERAADAHAFPLGDGTGRVALLFQERTIALKMDRQLSHRSAARSVTGMAAVLAHEIKNPLAGIRGAAQLIEQNAAPEDRDLTRLIRDEADRIRTLVDRLEIFGDNRPLVRGPVNIHEVLGRVRAIAAASFGRAIAIHEHYDPSLPPVHGDRDQLVQVVLNLVKNAADALEGVAAPEIVLSTAFRPGVRIRAAGSSEPVTLPLEVCVRDNGGGVAPDLMAILFDPFVTTKRTGSGLGLALVAKIIGDHGGVIECDSQPGATVFRMLLPMHAEPVRLPEREPAEGEA